MQSKKRFGKCVLFNLNYQNVTFNSDSLKLNRTLFSNFDVHACLHSLNQKCPTLMHDTYRTCWHKPGSVSCTKTMNFLQSATPIRLGMR